MKLDDLGPLAKEVEALRAEVKKAEAAITAERQRAVRAERELEAARGRIAWLEAEVGRKGLINSVDEEWLSQSRATIRFIRRARDHKVRLQVHGRAELRPTVDAAIAAVRARLGRRGQVTPTAKPPAPAAAPAAPAKPPEEQKPAAPAKKDKSKPPAKKKAPGKRAPKPTPAPPAPTPDDELEEFEDLGDDE